MKLASCGSKHEWHSRRGHINMELGFQILIGIDERIPKPPPVSKSGFGMCKQRRSPRTMTELKRGLNLLHNHRRPIEFHWKRNSGCYLLSFGLAVPPESNGFLRRYFFWETVAGFPPLTEQTTAVAYWHRLFANSKATSRVSCCEEVYPFAVGYTFHVTEISRKFLTFLLGTYQTR